MKSIILTQAEIERDFDFFDEHTASGYVQQIFPEFDLYELWEDGTLYGSMNGDGYDVLIDEGIDTSEYTF